MNWPLEIDRRLPEPVRVMLRGAGQVVFCGNALTGFFVLTAFYMSGMTAGMAATLGVVCSTVTAYALRFCNEDIQVGLYGFNGILAAVSLSVFLPHTPWLWLYIVIAAMLSSLVWFLMTRLLHFCRLPAATSPFVLISWIFLFMHASGNPPPDPALNVALEFSTIPFETWLLAFARSISQILFSDQVEVGVALLIGIALSTWRGAFMAIGGAIIGVALPMAIGMDPKAVEAGLYGFNPVLTMIALGSVFLEPTLRNALLTALAGMLAVFWQAVLTSLFIPLGLPVLASPFILTLWMVLLIVYKLRPRVVTVPN
ncbi:urea transporter [Nitrosomonas sp. JL21]|uniref:urea transporter n=1 Tax=Nitrosomonas sp. JL21 TaxID=153949 RepID=UPI00136E759D|nr:urea transporter [Nitrosomonas sp. JL21]MBL8497699.1 urea transporter [Nitrosomonas sp.]MXS78358.1 urea transporter [Nitrosomonas sp. JL21]